MPNHSTNSIGLINGLLYPVLFSKNPAERSEAVSSWIKEGKMGYGEGKQKYIQAIEEFMKDPTPFSETMNPDNEFHTLEDIKQYFSDIKERLID